MTQAQLIEAARNTAAAHGLDPALVCAVCETESSWIPDGTPRYEPAFEKKYITPMALPAVEAHNRSCSWGLMQIMGQTALELGWQGPFTGLLEPINGLEWGCRKLARCFLKAAKSVAPGTSDYIRQVLLLYNGGADAGYPDRVLSKLAKYQPGQTFGNIGALGGE